MENPEKMNMQLSKCMQAYSVKHNDVNGSRFEWQLGEKNVI